MNRKSLAVSRTETRGATDGADSSISALDALWDSEAATRSTSDALYQTLREAILRGIFPAGTRLGEQALAERFSVSRTPVREAIARLESDQLLDRLARRGAVVRSVTPDEIVEVYVIREVLDGLAASLAAYGGQPADLAAMQYFNDRTQDRVDSGDYQAVADLSLNFHAQMYRASRNRFLWSIMEQVHSRVRRFPGTTVSLRGSVAIEEHQEIIDAIRARDPARSELAARKHMRSALDVRIQMLNEHG